MLARTLALTLCVAGCPAFGHANLLERPAAPGGASVTATSGGGNAVPATATAQTAARPRRDAAAVPVAALLATATAQAAARAEETAETAARAEETVATTGETAGAGEAAARAGIDRFVQVDHRLYRGSQPDVSGFRYLRDVGIRTIVSLRNDVGERQQVESLGMTYVNIPVTMKPFGMSGDLSRDAVAQFFAIVDNPASGKVFLHCRRGADRTGAFVGLYRITRQGWDIDRAYTEAREIGMRWWHSSVKDQLKSLAASFPAPASVTASTMQ